MPILLRLIQLPEMSCRVPEVDDDCKVMASLLPLLREVIPSAATEVEADILERLHGGGLLQLHPFSFVYYLLYVSSE